MSEIKLNVQQFKQGVEKMRSFFDQRIMLILGKTENLKIYGLNSATFMYLLSYEFPETAIIIDDDVTFITSQRKSEILLQIGVKVIVRQKDDFSLEFLRKNGISGSYGMFDLKSNKGKFCEYVMDNITPVDLSHQLLKFYTAKTISELTNVTKGRSITLKVMSKAVSLIKDSIKEDGILTCRAISSTLENHIDAVSEDSNIDVIYSPVIQSKKFDLSRFECDSGPIDRNVLVRIGIRSHGFSSEIGRTILLGSDDDLYKDYALLFESRKIILEKFQTFLKTHSDENHSMELFIREINSSYSNSDSSRVIYSTGFVQNEGTLLAQSECYSFCIDLRKKCDNVLLNLCDNIIVSKGSVDYIFKDHIDSYVFAGRSVLKKESRFNQKEVEKNIQRNEHQKELMDALIEERIEYYKKRSYGIEEEVTEEKKRFVPYKTEINLPRHDYLQIDPKNFSILVPLQNYVLPIPAETIKNVSRTDDGIVRINLNCSGSGDMIKSISYKATPDHAIEVAQKITELKRDFNNRNEYFTENGKENNLHLIMGRKVILPDVHLKIDVKMRKTKPSALEIHENGFRYVCDMATVEILFDNIKHLFLQEGTTDTRAIIHFHLYEPIFIPKKTFNVQFYKECASSIHDTSKNRDEYQENAMELEEEQKRREINREFAMFVERLENVSSLRAEIPLKNGAFMGVPHKGTVLVQPTNSCLVNLVESPPFVLTLSEVEVACFERMVFGIKTFDLVLIFKNKETPVCHIQSVDSFYAHRIKDFLDGKNISFMETRINLQWNALIKEIMKNPLEFYENGAWCELQPHREEEEEESTTSEDSSIPSSSSSDSVGRNTDSEFSEESYVESEEEEEEEDSVISDSEEYEDEESSSDKRKKRRK